MRFRTLILVSAATLGAAAAPPAMAPATVAAPRPGVDWPQFRGIRAAGVSEATPVVTTWNVTDGRNVQWKTAIPGLGLSSPVVWGDRIFITSAISGKANATLRPGLYGDIDSVADDTSHQWRVYAVDKKTGAIVWQQTANTGIPKIKRHLKSSHANSTLATDGERLIAFFGSEGLYAYDLKGKLLWRKDLGVLDAGYYEAPDAQWETGSSPIIHDGVVIIQADVQKNSFLAAFDARDGKELWRVARNDVPTWSTPTVHEVDGKTQILVNGMRHAGAYDFKTGKEIWKLTGGGDIPVPTPVTSDGLVFLTNAHGPAAPVYAIRDTAKGDVSLPSGASSNASVVWSYPRDGGYMCTPLVYRGLVYVVRFNGVLTVYDAKTGARKFQERLGGGSSAFTASPVAADGKVYLASESGQVFVIKAGPAYEVASLNEMGASVLASPAISEGRLLFRTQEHLISIGAK
jgi:outer membrane protein assembly factor BamB